MLMMHSPFFTSVGKLPFEGDRLSVWDLGGQVELHGIWEKYYDECHGVIYVVDASDRERLPLAVEAFGPFLHSPVAQS